jgi:Uma2 family endonuclease
MGFVAHPIVSDDSAPMTRFSGSTGRSSQFVSSSRKGVMRKERIDGPCDLVVEIMSPASRRKDRLRKLEIYRQAGIPYYWLVDIEDNTLDAFVLKEGFYTLVFIGGPDDRFGHPEFPGLSLDLDRVFGGQMSPDDREQQ